MGDRRRRVQQPARAGIEVQIAIRESRGHGFDQSHYTPLAVLEKVDELAGHGHHMPPGGAGIDSHFGQRGLQAVEALPQGTGHLTHRRQATAGVGQGQLEMGSADVPTRRHKARRHRRPP